MEQARKSTYWLILPILMIIALGLSLAAAPTQSRYTTVTGWQMTLSQVEETLRCDPLTEGGQKIRLGNMKVGDLREIPLTLTAVGDAENVTVTVDSTHLTATMQWVNSVDNVEISQPEDIFDEEKLICTLNLTANEEAVQTVTTPTEASLQVTLTWKGGSLKGEFLVLLLPREASDEDAAATGDGGEDTPETADPDVNENEENVTENTENTEENGQTTEENTEIQTAAEGGNTTGGETAGGGNTEETPEDTTPEEDTSTSDELASPEEGTWLSGMSSFAADGVLPLQMEVPEGCGEIVLELGVDDADVGVFPAGTRYSADGGASYTLLYDPYVIAFTPQEGMQKASLLIDFSAVEIGAESLLTVTASALQGEEIFTVSTVKALASLSLPSIRWNTDPLVLTAGRSLQCVMPVYGDSHTVAVSPFNQEQTEGLPSVTLADGVLTVSSGGGAAKPGTYLTTLTWYWKGLEVARQEIVFYVNYTPYVQIKQEETETEQEAVQDTQTEQEAASAATGG